MRELVSATFATGWASAQPSVPLDLENEALPSSDTFAALTITLTTSAQMTQGARKTRRVRRNGYVQVKLWTPADTGAAGGAGLADTVRTVLEMVELPSPLAGDEPVTTQAGNTSPIGIDGRWYMTLVRIPFWYAETK